MFLPLVPFANPSRWSAAAPNRHYAANSHRRQNGQGMPNQRSHLPAMAGLFIPSPLNSICQSLAFSPPFCGAPVALNRDAQVAGPGTRRTTQHQLRDVQAELRITTLQRPAETSIPPAWAPVTVAGASNFPAPVRHQRRAGLRPVAGFGYRDSVTTTSITMFGTYALRSNRQTRAAGFGRCYS